MMHRHLSVSYFVVFLVFFLVLQWFSAFAHIGKCARANEFVSLMKNLQFSCLLVIVSRVNPAGIMQFRWHKKYRARLNECDPHIIMSDRNDNEQKNPPFTTDFCIIQRYQWPTSGLSYRLQQSHDFSMNTTNEKHNSIFTSFGRIETVNTEQLTTATSISNNNNKKCPMNLTYFACPIRISSYCCMENTIHIYSKCTKGNKFNGFVLWFFDWVFFCRFRCMKRVTCAHTVAFTRVTFTITHAFCVVSLISFMFHAIPFCFFFWLVSNNFQLSELQSSPH